jgi:hypothetical protein
MAKRTSAKASPITTTRIPVVTPSANGAATAVAPRPVAGPDAPKRGNGSTRLGNINLQPTVLTHDQIARRAYLLWQQTGNPDELHNWSEAERQLRRELGVA